MRNVLIVGAGPVGLTVALSLHRLGVPVTVLEKRPDLSGASRASTFHPPTIEILDGLGVLEPLLPLGQRVDRIAYLTRDGEAAASFALADLAGETAFPFRWHIEQSVVTPALMAALPAGAVQFAAEVADILEEPDSVAAILTDGRRFEGTYVLGCDGARSMVRQAIGVVTDGEAYTHRVLRVMTPVPLSEINPALGGISYIHAADGSCSLLQMPGLWRLIFRVPTSETDAAALAPDAIAARVRHFLPWAPDPLPISGTDIYRVAQGVARSYRVGRAVLLGDAAHVTNTRGGMNMNAGLHEASTLAGVLAAILSGRLADAALTEWAEARSALAREHLVARTDRAVSQTGLALLARMADLAADPARSRRFLLEGAMLDIARIGAVAA
jgi:2-polyprenyl-6-methoxyphenol hydroxylase-like FAD-dependent oxidoreductase